MQPGDAPESGLGPELQGSPVPSVPSESPVAPTSPIPPGGPGPARDVPGGWAAREGSLAPELAQRVREALVRATARPRAEGASPDGGWTRSVLEELLDELDPRCDLGPAARVQMIAHAAPRLREILVARSRARREAPGERGLLADALVEELERRATGLVELDLALDALARQDERSSRVVELRFFGGLDVPQTAEALGVEALAVEQDWMVARAWLARHVG